MLGIDAMCAKMTTFLTVQDLSTASEPKRLHLISIQRFYICRAVRLKRRGWAADIFAAIDIEA